MSSMLLILVMVAIQDGQQHVQDKGPNLVVFIQVWLC